MTRYGGFHGKPGRFWIVQSFVNGEWFYWDGVTDAVSNTNVYSYDLWRAAQFLSEQAAHFAADMMGGPRLSRRVEERIFHTSFVTD